MKSSMLVLAHDSKGRLLYFDIDSVAAPEDISREQRDSVALFAEDVWASVIAANKRRYPNISEVEYDKVFVKLHIGADTPSGQLCFVKRTGKLFKRDVEVWTPYFNFDRPGQCKWEDDKSSSRFQIPWLATLLGYIDMLPRKFRPNK